MKSFRELFGIKETPKDTQPLEVEYYKTQCPPVYASGIGFNPNSKSERAASRDKYVPVALRDIENYLNSYAKKMDESGKHFGDYFLVEKIDKLLLVANIIMSILYIGKIADGRYKVTHI